jgi:hypothetical protein
MKEYLKYFVGKVCTITTIQINFRYNVEQMLDYFSGIIEEIDDHGILMHHPLTKCKNYILFPYVVSISEEQVLFEDNPEQKKIIDEYRKEKPITSAKRTLSPGATFINPTALAEIAKQAKEAMLKPTP